MTDHPTDGPPDHRTAGPAEQLLLPGDHLVEITLRRPLAIETLRVALSRMGWSDGEGGGALIDESEEGKWSSPDLLAEFEDLEHDARERVYELQTRGPLLASDRRYRFVGRLDAPLVLSDTEDLRWSHVQGITLDPFGDLRTGSFPFELETGRAYEIRVLARTKPQPTRRAMLEWLAIMGWDPIRISAMKKDMRVEGRPNASFTLWYGLAVWPGVMSAITIEDPLFFKDVCAVDEEPPAASSRPEEREEEQTADGSPEQEQPAASSRPEEREEQTAAGSPEQEPPAASSRPEEEIPRCEA